MAPMISNTKNKAIKFDIIDKDYNERKNKLLQIRKFIEKNKTCNYSRYISINTNEL